jgi:hypothetical protein
MLLETMTTASSKFRVGSFVVRWGRSLRSTQWTARRFRFRLSCCNRTLYSQCWALTMWCFHQWMRPHSLCRSKAAEGTESPWVRYEGIPPTISGCRSMAHPMTWAKQEVFVARKHPVSLEEFALSDLLAYQRVTTVFFVRHRRRPSTTRVIWLSPARGVMRRPIRLRCDSSRAL